MKQDTIRAVAKPNKVHEYVTWDDIVSGLGKRHRPTKTSWIVQARVDGTSRKKTLGDVADLSPEIARDLARDQLRKWQGGYEESSEQVTVGVFADRYLEDCRGQWKSSTHKAHAKNVQHHITPHLGTEQLQEVSTQDVIAWRDALDISKASANRALAVLSGMFRYAEVLGLRAPGSNPCKGLRKRSTTFKATYLNDAD